MTRFRRSRSTSADSVDRRFRARQFPLPQRRVAAESKISVAARLRPLAAADGLPVLGEFPGVANLFVATAHYRNGILLAPETSRILADKITDASFESEYLKAFSPQRFVAEEKAQTF